MAVLFDDEPKCANVYSSLILIINHSEVIGIIIPYNEDLLREVYLFEI